VDADLRHPGLTTRLSHPSELGLSEFLSGQATFDEVVDEVVLQSSMNGSGSGRAMDVITAGRTPPNPVDLIESARMEQLLDEAQREYDLLVIDTPPTSIVSDAVPLLKQVSGVIVVSRIGATTRPAVVRLRDQLGNVGARLLGVVVNGVRSGEVDYGYYGHGGAKQKRPTRQAI
jgi:capsular exopolysaccharide synthesis family protein